MQVADMQILIYMQNVTDRSWGGRGVSTIPWFRGSEKGTGKIRETRNAAWRGERERTVLGIGIERLERREDLGVTGAPNAYHAPDTPNSGF